MEEKYYINISGVTEDDMYDCLCEHISLLGVISYSNSGARNIIHIIFKNGGRYVAFEVISGIIGRFYYAHKEEDCTKYDYKLLVLEESAEAVVKNVIANAYKM